MTPGHIDGYGVASPDFGEYESLATRSASLGLWLRVPDLTGKHVLYETGSDAQGASLLLDGDQLVFRVRDSSILTRVALMEARTTLSLHDVGDFLHVVATIRTESRQADQLAALRQRSVARHRAVSGRPAPPLVQPGWQRTWWRRGHARRQRRRSRRFRRLPRLNRPSPSLRQRTDTGRSAARVPLDRGRRSTLRWESGQSVAYVDFVGAQPASGVEHFVLANLGDGVTGWDASPVPVPPAGLYGIVELDGLWRLTGRDHSALSVMVRDMAPQVTLRGPERIDEGSLFHLTIGAPRNAGADRVTQYQIDWGDASGTESVVIPPTLQSIADVSLSHRYRDNGQYSVSVRIDNEEGSFVNPQVLLATVENVAPKLTVHGAPVADEGMPYSLTLGPVVDPGTDTASVWVDWGDASPVTSYLTPGIITHRFPKGPADHRVRVVIRDEDGVYGAAEQIVHVLDVPARVEVFTPTSVDEGMPFELQLGTVADPGGDPVPTIVGYVISWGDGSWQRLASPINLSHIYTDDDASRAVRVHLITATETITVAGQATVRVHNVPPQLRTVSITPLDEHDEVILTGQLSDPGVDDRLTLTIDWGEGRPQEVKLRQARNRSH